MQLNETLYAVESAERVPCDATFPESLEQTYPKIRSMIDEAK